MIDWVMDNLIIVLPMIFVIGYAMTLIPKRRKKIEDKPIEMPEDKFLDACNYACIAYTDNGQSEDEWRTAIKARPEWVSSEVFQSAEIDAFAGETEDAIFIAIRGTDGVTDVVSDLMARKVSVHEGKAHRGFYNHAHSLYYRLRLKDFVKTRSKPIYMGMHSLGAAAGIELAGIMLADGVRPAGMVALCAPRSSDYHRSYWLHEKLNGVLFRVTFCRDIVPMVPLRLMGFRHVGYTHYFDKDGMYHPYISTHFRILDFIGGVMRDIGQGKWLAFIGYHKATTVRDLVVAAVNNGRIKLRESDERQSQRVFV